MHLTSQSTNYHCQILIEINSQLVSCYNNNNNNTFVQRRSDVASEALYCTGTVSDLKIQSLPALNKI